MRVETTAAAPRPSGESSAPAYESAIEAGLLCEVRFVALLVASVMTCAIVTSIDLGQPSSEALSVFGTYPLSLCRRQSSGCAEYLVEDGEADGAIAASAVAQGEGGSSPTSIR